MRSAEFPAEASRQKSAKQTDRGTPKRITAGQVGPCVGAPTLATFRFFLIFRSVSRENFHRYHGLQATKLWSAIELPGYAGWSEPQKTSTV